MATVKRKRSIPTVHWENLPTDILSNLSKILNSDIDNLRLRSVCSSWRSSLPPPSKPFSFPLKLPPLSGGNKFVLDEITLYRLSPLADQDDSSNGWLLRAVSQTKPNTFTLLNPVTMREMDDPIPKQLNLLEYRISEICKYHKARCPISCKKVIALWNYFRDCDFAVLVLNSDGSLNYWKIGDEDWTPIDTKIRGKAVFVPNQYKIHDVILFQGKCYAVIDDGSLLRFDSAMNLTIAAYGQLKHDISLTQVYLVECHSDLYVVPHYSYDVEDDEDAEQVDVFQYEQARQVAMRKFIEVDGRGYFNCIEDLKGVFFILSDHASHSFNSKDFAGFKGERAYVNDECFDLAFKPYDYDMDYKGDMLGAYDFEDSGKEISPPRWLHV